MKNIIRLLVGLFLLINLHAEELTKKQLNKLNNPMVILKDNVFTIKEYNFINFKEKISILGIEDDRVTIKTTAVMKKGVINKELFIAFSASISDQVINALFLNPVHATKIQSTGLYINKPEKIDLKIVLVFTDKGVSIVLNNKKKEQKSFISYNQIFLREINL